VFSKVLIIGAGTGGLCLAQGLKQAGVDASVFERDRTPTDRLQGYRLHISASGARALERCLPATLFGEFLVSVAKPNRAVTFLDSNLKTLLTFPIVADPNAESRELPVSRITLRKLLLQGLEGVVNFEKRFHHYEQRPDGRVVAHFEDGSAVEGDLLIGADGASSTIRAQLLPYARRIDTGIVAISGKAPLNDYVRRLTPPQFFQGPTLVLGPGGKFLFGSAVEFPSNGGGKSTGPQLVSSSSDDLLFGERAEYVMWGLSCRRGLFPEFANAKEGNGDELMKASLRVTTGWHASLRALIEATAPETINAFQVKSAERIAPWNTGPVTLLGDSIHNMTPYRGMGANMALLDADALRLALLKVHRGESDLIPALHVYEAEMIDRGFRAVEASLKQMKQVHSEGRFANGMRALSFRTIDRLPVHLKRAIMQHR
jgi:2-polyprenyl-6-methoxyphenol hydroxylase-like FAD-dependent oxidoreductase